LAIKIPIIVYRWAAVLWLAAIVFLLFLPGDDLPDVELIPFQDKVVHFVLFAGYSFLWLGGFYFNGRFSRRRSLTLILGFGAATAVLTEWIQQLVPGRQGGLIDLLVDLLGLLIGTIFYLFLEKRNHSAQN
jgi:VanZ family protein